MDMIEELRQKQRDYYLTGETQGIRFRKIMLRKLLKAVQHEEAAFIEALRLDLGKPEFESYSNEIGYVYHEIRHALRNVRKWSRIHRVFPDRYLLPGRGRIIPEPYGNVLVLAPWNYPMQLLFAPMVAAIAAGNTVVLKPSEHAPHTARVSQRVIEDNFAPEYAAVVQGEADVSRQLIQQGFDYLFFTGSPAVGRMVMSAAAEHLTPVTLELGGKSPVVVDRSADIGVAARKIAWGKFNNAGQTCVAPDYILVHESAAEELTAKLRETIIDFYGRNPAGSKDYGRIVNDRQFERLHRLLDTSPVVHGGSFEAGTRYIEPTVMYPVQWSDPIMQEEIFGPILPVLTYSSLDDAIERIRGFDRPLALYVFARNRQVEKRVIHEIPFGGGGVNCTLMHVGSSKLPFGGIGSSGMGRYHGKAGFDTFSHFKSILSQPGSFDLPIVYPGKQISMKLLRKLIR